MTCTAENDGYATAFFALFLMDAWKNRDGKSMDLLRNLPDLPIRLKALTSRLRREGKYNKTGEGTAASHGGDAIAELIFTKEKVLERYGEFEKLFRAFYNRFMERRKAELLSDEKVAAKLAELEQQIADNKEKFETRKAELEEEYKGKEAALLSRVEKQKKNLNTRAVELG